MTDKIADELRLLANTAGRTLSDNSMMPPGIPDIGDVLAEKMASLMRTAADTLDAKEAGGWQPIETAPKAPVDSPECWLILGWWPSGVVETVYWGSGGWWPANFDSDVPWSEPTHWQPLPAPPSRLLNKEDRNG